MTPDQFRHYTPAEFNELLDAKTKNRREEWEFQDMKNAMQCWIVAACAGNKDSKPADFLILRKDEPERKPENPESLAEKLKMLTLSMGGTVK